MSRAGLLVLLLSVLVEAVLLVASAGAVVEQPFDVRYSANDTGAIWVTGNTLMTCPVVDPACAAAQAGTAGGAALNNNGYAMTRVDADGDPATFDSSSSTLAPGGAYSVLFAGLYWGGRTTAGTGGTAAIAPGARGSVVVRGPGGGSGYVSVAGAVADSAAVPGAYTGFADVTALVAAGGPGVYTVGNVQAGTGLDRYAGWGLVVVYRSATQPLRNLTVFDGLAAIQQGDPPLSLTVSGFTTPQTGAVRTAVGVVAYEGDRGSAGDRALLGGQPLTDAANPANNLFNSSISAEGVDTSAARTPGVRQPARLRRRPDRHERPDRQRRDERDAAAVDDARPVPDADGVADDRTLDAGAERDEVGRERDARGRWVARAVRRRAALHGGGDEHRRRRGGGRRRERSGASRDRWRCGCCCVSVCDRVAGAGCERERVVRRAGDSGGPRRRLRDRQRGFGERARRDGGTAGERDLGRGADGRTGACRGGPACSGCAGTATPRGRDDGDAVAAGRGSAAGDQIRRREHDRVGDRRRHGRDLGAGGGAAVGAGGRA